ncbi:hypothetical protein LTS10_002629 [Elasticomyces elasticus]|nr:hypothetical protein LTS10_002629 [Elasticomyces elasticus]
MADDNSSDWEFAPAAPKLRPSLGQKSIDRIVRDATDDRQSNGQTTQIWSRVQSTRDKYSLWLTRINAYRQETLKQSQDAPFKMDDILRFFESVLNKSKLKIMDGKPGRSSYGWTLAQCTWIGFVTLSRMIRAYLTHTLKHGTMNWDIRISRYLGVVLQAALGCRAGDIARTIGYKGTEYMKFRDIDLKLNITKTGDPNAILADIRATVTIPYAKGYKNRPGESAVKYLNPLLDPECQHICPIALLLAHSLRNGLCYRVSHESECTQATVESLAESAGILQSLSTAPENDPRVCPRARATGCPFKALGKNPEGSIKSHLAQTHDYISKPCKHGCDPEQDMTYRQMLTHNQKHHNNSRYPAPCAFPDCSGEESTFSSRDKLKWHLTTVHGLQDADARKPYFPAITTEVWTPQPCLVTPCKSAVSEIETRSHMLAHILSGVHGMNKQDAEALIDEGAVKGTLKGGSSTKAQSSTGAVKRSFGMTEQPPAKKQNVGKE